MKVKERKPDTLRVLLIDFNPVVREGLLAILATDEGIEVAGNVPDGHEALQHIKRAGNQGAPVNVVLTETRNGLVDRRTSDQAYQRGLP
jgi:DNA-binding NarL/FixJ family response regulator